MDASAKGRARLWLRSERAMGLSSLPVKLAQPAAPVATPALARPTPQRPVPAAAPRPAPVAAARRQPEPAPAPQPARVELFVSQAFEGPELSREEKIRVLGELDEKQVKACTKCRLHETRTHTVFGEGAPDAQLMFIGEIGRASCRGRV